MQLYVGKQENVGSRIFIYSWLAVNVTRLTLSEIAFWINSDIFSERVAIILRSIANKVTALAVIMLEFVLLLLELRTEVEGPSSNELVIGCVALDLLRTSRATLSADCRSTCRLAHRKLLELIFQ